MKLKYSILLFLLLLSITIYLGKLDYIYYLRVIEEINSKNIFLSLILFSIIYFAAMLLALPVSLMLNVLGGFLFGYIIGGFISTLVSTLSAIVTFKLLNINSPYKKIYKYKLLKTIQKKIKFNEILYIFILRILPIIPFSIQNIFLSICKVSYSNYVIFTFLGSLPLKFLGAVTGEKANLIATKNVGILNIYFTLDEYMILSLIFLLFISSYYLIKIR